MSGSYTHLVKNSFVGSRKECWKNAETIHHHINGIQATRYISTQLLQWIKLETDISDKSLERWQFWNVPGYVKIIGRLWETISQVHENQ